MRNPLLFFIASLFFSTTVFSQRKISSADVRVLQKKEDSLKVFAKAFLTEAETADRMRQDSLFIKTLIRSLQVKHSFYYPFDSVKGVSHLYAPDSSFRIFTWQLSFDNDYAFNRQRGAIQLQTQDGSLRLIPLLDYSEYADNPLDSARTRNNWIGAVYYNIIKTQHNGKNYYTLFGFDGNSYRTNKKWLDVLTFDAQNNPVFGSQQFFSFEKDSFKRKPQFRYAIEYKKEASTTLNFDEDMKMIIVDHLVSETNEPEYAWTFVPDGDYEGFQWVNGKWQHIDKVYDFKLEDGDFPMPDALKDAEGNSDQLKLSNQNKKNIGEKEPTKPAPKKPVKKGN
ncbi:MAG: hypothetical protein EOO10_05745 [Chitinophagaceae bacterium]|nr:MAG: hypothetical protein EOO10_05745 [Chitinophagaceae bacterium]